MKTKEEIIDNEPFKVMLEGSGCRFIPNVREQILMAMEEYASQSKWIDVKERLPEHGIGVLGMNRVMVYSQTIRYNKFKETWELDRVSINHVTHWQPLPELPKL